MYYYQESPAAPINISPITSSQPSLHQNVSYKLDYKILPCNTRSALLETLEAFLCSHLKCKKFPNMEKINPLSNLFNTFIPNKNEHHVAVSIPRIPSSFVLFLNLKFLFSLLQTISAGETKKNSECKWAMATVFSLCLLSFLLEKPQSLVSYTSMEGNEIHFPLLTYLEKFFQIIFSY